MPDAVSAYLDSQYDPEKDGELGPDDERLSAAEVIQDDLGMTTECNPAAGIWPARCEDVMGILRENSGSKRCVSTRIGACLMPRSSQQRHGKPNVGALGTCRNL